MQWLAFAEGIYDDVVWVTAAVTHMDTDTEYVESDARGRKMGYGKI